ncbi:hypothetical protein HDU93_000421, partial [Gonapodya sp. JEL0774]
MSADGRASRAGSVISDGSAFSNIDGPFTVKATVAGVTRLFRMKEPPVWNDLEAQ